MTEGDKRQPVRPHYDAVVDLLDGGDHGVANALVKCCYTLDGPDGGLVAATAEPLLHDVRDPEAEAQYQAGSDFYPHKEATDVVLRGQAYNPRPAPYGEVVLRVGRAEKRVAVFGRRFARRHGDTFQFDDPEPFSEICLGWGNTYGGMDSAVLPEPEELEGLLWPALLESDNPGLYPRNPFGKGYVVLPRPDQELELPNLEDPQDLLTPERLAVGDPRRWYLQPLPWGLDWVHPMTFPRYTLYQGHVDAWYPGPEDRQMPEVARGYHPAGYRGMMTQRPVDAGPHPSFFQEASAGLVLRDVEPGTPVVLEGVHPEHHRLRFTVPDSPDIELVVAGDRQRVRPRLHHLVCLPETLQVQLVYGASRPMPSTYLPGIHREIPLAVCVDGDDPVRYPTPPNWHDHSPQVPRAFEAAGERKKTRW